MKVELLRGSKRTAEPVESNKPDNVVDQQQNEGPGLLGRLGYAVGKGFEAPGNAIDALLQLLGEPKASKGSFVEDIAKKAGYSPNQFEPQSTLESYGQRFLKQAPVSAAFGPASLASTALGTGVATGAEALGAPEYVQDIAQLGTEIAAGALSGKIPTLGKAQKTAYTAAKSEVPKGARYESSPISNAINITNEKLATEVSPKIEKKVTHAIEKIENNIRYAGKGKESISPIAAMDLRRKLYDNVEGMPYEYTKELTSGINDFFASYAADNPKFYDLLKKADKYTELKNMQPLIEKAIDKLPLPFVDKIPWARDVFKGAFKVGTLGTVSESEKVLRRIYKSPLAREHYFDVVKSVSNPSLFVRNLNELGQIIAEEELDIPHKKPSSENKIEVLRGSRI